MRNIRTQCKAQGVAFFFKQWGGVRKAETGRRLDGRTYDDFPNFRKADTLESGKRLLLLREVETEYCLGTRR